jgi:hypothetical protein
VLVLLHARWGDCWDVLGAACDVCGQPAECAWPCDDGHGVLLLLLLTQATPLHDCSFSATVASTSRHKKTATHFMGMLLLLLTRLAADSCLLRLLAQLLLPLTKLLRPAPVRYACTVTAGLRTRLRLRPGRPRHGVLPSCCCCCCCRDF